MLATVHLLVDLRDHGRLVLLADIYGFHPLEHGHWRWRRVLRSVLEQLDLVGLTNFHAGLEL